MAHRYEDPDRFTRIYECARRFGGTAHRDAGKIVAAAARWSPESPTARHLTEAQASGSAVRVAFRTEAR